MLYYNAETEEITVGDAPYVSATPKETKFGFLAKVVPTTRKTPTSDECSDCTDVATQELASQLMDKRNDGRLVVANVPLPGELPACSPDADVQTRLDYLEPKDYTGCDDYSFLIAVDGEKRVGRTTVKTKFWHFLRKLRFRSSMLAPIKAADASGGKKVLAFPTGGGTDTDPCYQLRMVEGSPSDTLPSNAVKCDSAVYDGEGWKAFRHGHWPFFTSSPMANDGTGATWEHTGTMGSGEDLALENKPTSPCGGKIFAMIELYTNSDGGSSSSTTQSMISIDGTDYLANISSAQRSHRMIFLDVTTLENISVRVRRVTGTGQVYGAVNIIGYAA